MESYFVQLYNAVLFVQEIVSLVKLELIVHAMRVCVKSVNFFPNRFVLVSDSRTAHKMAEPQNDQSQKSRL